MSASRDIHLNEYEKAGAHPKCVRPAGVALVCYFFSQR
jgi:hypothetical protein